jgi:hypothetical protein
METAWLIEMPLISLGGPTCWWTGKHDTGFLTDPWTQDTLDAVRFSRKVDAEKVIKFTLRSKLAIATEHQWIDPAPKAKE